MNSKVVPMYALETVALALLAFASSLASAHDHNPLQDFCVAIDNPTSAVLVNGKFCKDPKLVTADDFFRSVNIPGNTSNKMGSNVTAVTVEQLPGLNTLGISLARIDFAPRGLNPPHTHPRGTEILVVIEGTLHVGFVTSNADDNRLFTKVLNKGDVFVFPMGLVHFQLNIENTNAVAFAGLSSQNPGVITIANAVFGSNPPINQDVLTKASCLFIGLETYLQKLSFATTSQSTTSLLCCRIFFRGQTWKSLTRSFSFILHASSFIEYLDFKHITSIVIEN